MAVRKWYSVNTERGLNLRSEPSKTAPILKILKNGERVEADNSVDVPDGWIAIKDQGFVMKQFLK